MVLLRVARSGNANVEEEMPDVEEGMPDVEEGMLDIEEGMSDAEAVRPTQYADETESEENVFDYQLS